MTEVQLRIRRLELDGFDLDARHARTVQAAVEAELGRLLGGGPLPAGVRAGGRAARLPGALEIGAWRDPHDLGAQVARTLYHGMGGESACRPSATRRV